MRLGVFDSGLGGLTVVRALRERLPNADILYFADQANVPYGSRSLAELYPLVRQHLEELVARGAEAIVMGCNTSCAVFAHYGYPDVGVPIYDLVEAGAQAVFSACHFHVGVIATVATIHSKIYQSVIHRAQQLIEVEEIAAPELVPLIEAHADDAEIQDAVERVVQQFRLPITALVLGCTHYPLIADQLSIALPKVSLIDPARAQADIVATALALEHRHHDGDGTLEAWTSGDPLVFAREVEQRLMNVKKLEKQEYRATA